MGTDKSQMSLKWVKYESQDGYRLVEYKSRDELRAGLMNVKECVTDGSQINRG